MRRGLSGLFLLRQRSSKPAPTGMGTKQGSFQKFSRRKFMIFSKKRAQRGQGMTEYIIIVALIAIAAIAVYQFFGDTVRAQTGAIAQELAGQNGDGARGDAVTAANAAANQANTQRNLTNYTNNVGAQR
jgi:type IV pilus assembly protein PilA